MQGLSHRKYPPRRRAVAAAAAVCGASSRRIVAVSSVQAKREPPRFDAQHPTGCPRHSPPQHVRRAYPQSSLIQVAKRSSGSLPWARSPGLGRHLATTRAGQTLSYRCQGIAASRAIRKRPGCPTDREYRFSPLPLPCAACLKPWPRSGVPALWSPPFRRQLP